MGQRVAGLKVVCAAAVMGGSAFAQCAPDSLELRNAAGTIHRFSVELADDPDERARGLMFREKMPMASGMLFVFPEPKHATFWMKDTPLALDIFFVVQAGQVTRVHENAVPLSEALIDGGPGVAYAFEINAGLAGRMGIGPGAVMRHPSIAADHALWPCEAP
jgi:uncharacterized membrane protein (UPF0127 family)